MVPSPGTSIVTLSPNQVQLAALAKAVVDDLSRADAAELPSDHGPSERAICAELEDFFKRSSALERDAERMADEHLKAAGRDGLGLDRRMIIRRVKEKLASERDFPA